MSLRGSETTEAITQVAENEKIATLPSVSRNDKKEFRYSLKGGGIKKIILGSGG